jgi:hypothetical protein
MWIGWVANKNLVMSPVVARNQERLCRRGPASIYRTGLDRASPVNILLLPSSPSQVASAVLFFWGRQVSITLWVGVTLVLMGCAHRFPNYIFWNHSFVSREEWNICRKESLKKYRELLSECICEITSHSSDMKFFIIEAHLWMSTSYNLYVALYNLLIGLRFYLEDGGNMLFWNMGELLSDYKESDPLWLLWEPQT